MPLIPADQMPNATEPDNIGPSEFDPAAVDLGQLRNPAKIAAKIEAAKKAHMASAEERGVPNVEPAVEEEPPAPPVQVIERRIETITVEIPLGEPPRRFNKVHLEVLLYGDHAHTWARLRQALRDKDARTADGKEVKAGRDILRWLLEQLE